MSPEHLSGDMWYLESGERITGRLGHGGYTLIGPQILRVHTYPDLGEKGMLRIQGSETIEVDGTDLASQVISDKKDGGADKRVRNP